MVFSLKATLPLDSCKPHPFCLPTICPEGHASSLRKLETLVQQYIYIITCQQWFDLPSFTAKGKIMAEREGFHLPSFPLIRKNTAHQENPTETKEATKETSKEIHKETHKEKSKAVTNNTPVVKGIVYCCYNTVNFLTNPHNRHPIARPSGRGMGCHLWVQSLICVLLCLGVIIWVYFLVQVYFFYFKFWFMFCLRHCSAL